MGNSAHLIFDGLHRNQSKRRYEFYAEGSSPNIFRQLVSFLERRKDDITEITLANYLFNNLQFANQVRRLAQLGVKVNVISIPLEGYDTQPARCEGFNSYFTGEGCPHIGESRSKYDFAERIYRYLRQSGDYSLHQFEHVYLRSPRVNRFSRGRVPFSLHIKSILIEMRDGSSFSVLTSSNLALRDTLKEELCLIVQNTADDLAYSRAFYRHLIEHSKQVSDVDLHTEHDYSHYRQPFNPIEARLVSGKEQFFFTAPFLAHSNQEIEGRIRQKIASAQRRVLLCAQHINTFEAELKQATASTQGAVKIKLLSQTYIDETHQELANGTRYPDHTVLVAGKPENTRVPANPRSFKEFIARLKQNVPCEYYFNQDVHLKFIVVDDDVIISTGNFTLTQFVYEAINIDKFEKFDGSYQGTFSEVNGYFVRENAADLANQLAQHFECLIKLKDTYQPI